MNTKIIFAKSKDASMKRNVEQINGREGETASLLSTSLVSSMLRGGGFAPRHLNR